MLRCGCSEDEGQAVGSAAQFDHLADGHRLGERAEAGAEAEAVAVAKTELFSVMTSYHRIARQTILDNS